MAQPVSDDEIQLRKRARRRLVGAIVLVLMVVVFLPMVLDNEPKPLPPNVAINIPQQGSADGKFPDQPPAAPVAAPPAAVVTPRPPGTNAPAVPLDAKLPEPTTPPPSVPASPAGADTAKPATAPPGSKSEQVPAKSAEARKPDAVGKVQDGKNPEEAKQPDDAKKAVEAHKPQDPHKQEAPRKTDEPRQAEGAGKPDAPAPSAAEPVSTAKPRAAGASTARVIQLGVFSDPNNAKQLIERVRALDIPGYTEEIPSAAGVKTRVRAGPFPTQDAAAAARAKLLSLKLTQSELRVVRQGE